MLFNSAAFLIFFIIVYSIYILLYKKYHWQNVLLFAASYIFYGWWDVRFLYLIILATVIDYLTSLLVDRGRLTAKQFIKAFAFLLSAAFFCVTVQWDAVSWHLNGWRPVIDIDWNALLPLSVKGWWVFNLTLFVSIALALFGSRILRSQWATRRFYMFVCIFLNLVILGVFKYFNFFADNLITVFNHFGFEIGQWTYRIILPVGISFFTFQALSHTVDVYRGQIKASDSLLELAVYISYFPQLVAGPIERGSHLLPQFQRPRTIQWDECREGLWLIFWGLYKKAVVADNIALVVNNVFGPYDSMQLTTVPEDGMRCLLAIYAFAIQIYCDFSGYTDIARGVAKLMGFDIMLNFNLPYIAVNPSDFWRRWHISLSSWLRDYLYIPLGGSRGGTWFTYRNLILTMVLGGLWHGAAWTFVLWGAFHGAILVLYRVLGLNELTDKARFPMNIIYMVIMFHLVCFGWLLFRAQNMTTVSLFLKSILTSFSWSTEAAECLRKMVFYGWFLMLFQLAQAKYKSLTPLTNSPWFLRLNIWLFVVMSILVLSPRKAQEFIYFAF